MCSMLISLHYLDGYTGANAKVQSNTNTVAMEISD